MNRVFLAAIIIASISSSSSHAGSSNSLLDLTPDGATLIVANTDNGTVTVIDTKKRTKLHEIEVGDKPEGVAWIGNGPLALVTVYRDDRVAFVDTRSGKVIHSLAVPNEPYGIVVDRSGKRAWVTHDYPGLVSEIDVPSHRVVQSFKVGAFVRGAALSPDETRLYVTEFYTSNLHAVDLSQRAVVDTWVGGPTDNLCRNVVVHPRRPKAYLSHTRSITNVISSRGSIFPHLTVADLVSADAKPKRRMSSALDTFNGVYVVTNPWEAALSPDGSKLYTIYAGTDDMNVSQVIDDDYKEFERIGRAAQLGKNPRAIRLSPDGKLLYVSNTLDFSVGVYDAETLARIASIPVCAPPKTPEWVRGKILFNSAKQPMTNARWVACASCHPDGNHDGRVWENPEGLRRTTGFFGMAHTHPIHWSADRDEVQDFEYTIRGKLMAGRGLWNGSIRPKSVNQPTELSETLSGRSTDLDALAIYCNSFDFKLSPHAPNGKLTESAERGKTLFFSAQTQCATCHNGPYFTDSNLKTMPTHDVGTGADDPREKMGPRYDTPTLLGIYRHLSYLHHGKARTLMDVLTTYNSHDQHGKTSQLTADERADLVEFLKSLPYETPPDETPNTVKFRVPAKKK